ncbi:MAG TPA: thioredoxin-disulfide reductase [Candidatus Kapabacteria bacterium]|jgi:thioredoxin reductase (NADPH)|nr:thioredoxin-disulfide reductase [Candidatus Kapabacteria bacterium]HOM04926.1 thioredoxin-disulfide reductase [Candidatus Kapabacteria bacterium]HPU23390.1 thioredoxin-disulfide reductase [Candidatus Kapabacteria bacterium]
MEIYDVVVLGSGPAGLTAALYASRANLKVIVLEGLQPGGQLTITTEVENFPGFENGVQGPEMMDIFRRQAQRFGAETVFEIATKVDFSKRPFTIYTANGKEFKSKAVIIATGASAKLLGLPSEQKYWGAGISACATCDGFFYRGKKVFVVGGGDTALEEAIYLTNHASSVTVIHRRNEFRASKIMVDRAKSNPKITFILDSVVEEFLGEEKNGIKSLTGIKIRNVKTNEISEHSADGVFIAIGHKPNTDIFKEIINLDENGYIITEGKSTYTNIPGVFACGDVQDHVYRQAVTAAGSGCMAAIDCERWLNANPLE